ncbi:DNRLRE domain-containing protein [Streptomyces alkaliterrae]|uniref:DNRLRE domain-containing protein n=2 Tax=Streptomyces alkaliterrae TaxID=2213162 RepID=A0A5P0YQ62_9ACTN|nr:DNRLRE domain-containing protein [Streptomyces alkaliterrae]MBB1257627.1 RHS repeat-associated core domain-containing protein [Streptomyces alkaliterrae]MQS02494.1 DNRLRE domain-containing protein [Streptomyces alkaliterrae]
MAVTALDSATAAAAKPSPEPKAQQKQAVTEAADIPSARVAARLSGKRVEVLSERTETSTTWANKDGSLTTELAAGPIRFQDEDTGAWRDVDLDLISASDGSVEPVAHPEGLRLAGKSGSRATSLRAAQKAKGTDLVTLGDDDKKITLQWKGGLPAPKLDGTRAEYVNAVPGADVVVEATRTGFEQFVEIKERPSGEKYSYTLPLKAKGLKAEQQDDGSVEFTDRKGRTRAVMPAPVMWDSTVDKVSGEHTRRVPVEMEVVQRRGSIDLVVTPDAKFLADPATKYPVVVDPSTSALSNVFDTYVQQGETRDWSTDVELDLGNPGTTNSNGTPRTARSFISWNTTPIRDALVMDAKLSLWNFHSGNTDCKAQPWEVWRTGAASTSSRWTSQPTWTARKATSTQTRGNPACTSAPNGWINADVTTLVQEWASEQVARGHMGLRAASETSVPQWKRVNSANAASNPPKLTVTYNYRPKTGTKQEAGPPYFSYGGSYVVNTVRPTLRDTFVDANGDRVQGAFQIFDSATDKQVGEVLRSSFVPSGQPASVRVPAGVLTHGKTYKFRTSPYDGTHYNTGWSAWKTFTVDTQAPSAPTRIVSTDYPADKWVKGAGQAGTFTVTPASADLNWLEWSLDGATWTKVPTAASTTPRGISITPPRDGTHTLQVRAVDRADNKSEAAEYTFHAGPGGFVQPSEGERTARRLPLVAEAEAGRYTAVSFSWRRSEADPWTRIPTKDVTSGGSPVSAWPVPMTNGRNAPLVWKATDTVDPDGTVQIKADFTGPNSASGSTTPLTVVVDRNASGAATTEAGPGSVNLLTGDYTLSATDASAFDMSVTRTASSRTPDKGAAQEGQAPIFGEEWVAGTAAELTESDWSHIRRITDTAVAVIDADGEETYFTANAAKNGWIPEPGAEDLTLKGSVTGTFTLSDTEGTVTTFTKPAEDVPTWQVSSTLLDGLAESTTTVISQRTTYKGNPVARPKWIIAPTSAATTAECAADPATKGCRVLEFLYPASNTATEESFGDRVGRVKSIRLWATEPGADKSKVLAVNAYAYDTQGRLRESWSPRTSPALKTEYTYDSAGRVTELTSPGELPWTFTYGKAGDAATAGEGMLLKVSRSGLKQGTANTPEGTATTSLVYDVPLTGSRAPYKMGASDTRAWGQLDTGTDATAVFPADSVPAGHTGSSLTATAYRRANVHYLGVSGREVNTAIPGGHITTTEYDRFGNTVRELSAANRAVALGLSADDRAVQEDLGISQLPSAERAELLATRSVYNEEGTRELEQFGPLRRVDLTEDLKSGSNVLVPSDTSVTARSWTVNEYDAGRPTNGTAKVKDQITRVTTGAEVREHPGVMGEARATQTVYDWVKGLPTRTIKDPGGLAITESTEYDAQGRVTKQRLPGANGTDAATRVTTYWSATGTGACAGRPEWADLVCSTGPAGAITGGGSQPSELPTTTTEYNWWGSPAKVTETANGVTRTTTTTYDSAGRQTKVAITGGIGQAVPEATTEYDPATGQAVKTVSPTGGTITKAYDRLGRLISYTDADGGVTRTEYDLLDRPVKVTDSAPSTTTYTYDHTAEPRGLATRVTDSVAGAFQPTYDADGSVSSEKLPGGYTLTVTEDATGSTASRVYTRDSDDTLVYSDTVTESVHGQVTSHAGWSEQAYSYDRTGRLTTVLDTADTVCTRRAYTFDNRTNRRSLTSASGTPGADCPTTGGTTTTHTYDSADRLVDSGYVYDAFGRTTTAPGNGTLAYYANDLAYRQTAGGKRQTWTLDAAHRFRSWRVETGSGSTWTQTESKRNHYDGDGDNPRWIVEDTATGALTRIVNSASGDLAATTGKTGDTVLQLSTIHGGIALQLPLDTTEPPAALDNDEYGNPREGQQATRYGWLGAKKRSTESLSGLSLMGVRLYDSTIGRFLSLDPIYGGNANGYEYVNADPLNRYDLDGKWGWNKRIGRSAPWRYVYWGARVGITAGFIASPFGRVRTVRTAYRLIRKPRRAYGMMKRSCGSWRGALGCIGAGIGVGQDARQQGREYWRAYNDLYRTRPARWFKRNVWCGPGSRASGCRRR